MNLTQYTEQLQSLKQRASLLCDNLEREKGYILDTQNRVQGDFGDQLPGQQIVIEFYAIINHLNSAETALENLNSQIDTYIMQVHR